MNGDERLEELIRQLRSEPEKALDALLGRYGGLVYAAAKSVLGENAKEEIEECVLDVFFALYRRRDALDFASGSIKAYLCAAAKGMAIDRVRKRQRTIPAGNAEADDMRDPFLVEQTALERAERDAIVSAIRSLGEPSAGIVIRRYYFNMSTREIARSLHMSESAVDQRLTRAKKALRVILKGGETDEANGRSV